jgi:hypothetical protein
MDKFARKFENIHRTPYVVGTVDGSQIPIVVPRLYAVDYYNRKGFHSILLRDVVSRKCMFWDFDIGWAGSMYDANLWRKTAVGQFYEAGKLAPYALVGDAAYPCRPWMLVPFRGHKDELAVANHALHSLAGIEESSRETLEYIKQDAAREFQILMTIGGKIAKELCARRNEIAKSLWMAKTKACVI